MFPEAHLNFWNTIFPLIFAVSFGFFGIIFPIAFALLFKETTLTITIFLFSSIFAIIGIGAAVIAIKAVIKYNSVKTKGKELVTL